MPNTNDSGAIIGNSVFTMDSVCPECGSTEFELRNYNMVFHDGDIHCARCGKYIRMFDAG